MDKKTVEKAFYGIGTLGGLLLMVIGFVGVGILAFKLLMNAPNYPYGENPPTPTTCNCELKDKCTLTNEERESLSLWREEFKGWRQRRQEFEGNRLGQSKNDLAASFAFLLVGTPIFLLFKSRFSRS